MLHAFPGTRGRAFFVSSLGPVELAGVRIVFVN
jgi:hypothetical protein